jgi:hypothetical protein
MDPSVRNKAVRLSSGATICIEKTIKVHIFPSRSANWQNKLLASRRKKRANSNRPERGIENADESAG